MSSNVISEHDILHLANQFEKVSPILFTGAGFSLGAKNIVGSSCPSYDELRTQLWDICFTGEPFDNESTVQDLYDVALVQHKSRLNEYLISSFTIDAESVPEWYIRILNLPWYKCYTLNVDNIEDAVSRKFKLHRDILSLSAMSESIDHEGVDGSTNKLRFVHLNGMLKDIPDRVTFSLTQYANRLAHSDPWYMQLTTELLCHPIVFIGTRLNEPPLWQHIELRKMKGARGTYELRPRSYLVIPRIDAPRKGLLSRFNVIHFPLTAEQCTIELYDRIPEAINKGLQEIDKRKQLHLLSDKQLSYVHEIASDLTRKTNYLLGEPPDWSDIANGRAIERNVDDVIWDEVHKITTLPDIKGIFVITGTAGAGKSTSLMRLAFRLNSIGKKVGWVDADSGLGPRELRHSMLGKDAAEIIAIDDADIYGRELGPMIRDISLSDNKPLVLMGIRSGRIDRFINPVQIKDIPFKEVTMPHLEDVDISALIDVLERENRLGILKNKRREEQEKAFRDKAGRILIVGMIEATSGKLFKEKLIEELDQLEPLGKRIYSLLTVTTHFRFGLSKEDILISLDDPNNEVLNTLELLQKRNLLSVSTGLTPQYSLLHRIIADIIFDQLVTAGELYANILSIGIICATRITPFSKPSDKYRRLLRLIFNHDFLLKNIGLEQAREVYGTLENYSTLTNDFHYWLQRGSLEVEDGSLDLAENFLNQARALNSGSPLVENEYAYLLLRKAVSAPNAANAGDYFDEASQILTANIITHGHNDPYPFHILGSQGLTWVRRGLRTFEEKKKYLEYLQSVLNEGCEKHPKSTDLRDLCEQLKREYLSLAVT